MSVWVSHFIITHMTKTRIDLQHQLVKIIKKKKKKSIINYFILEILLVKAIVH